MKRETVHVLIAASLVALVMSCAAPSPSAAKDDGGATGAAGQAASFYADARYTEALPLLEEIDRAGDATGPLLYRLAYCQRATGDPARAAETERRARETLEDEVASATSLEVPFYLCNVYQNAGREGDARRVATEATARVERGDLARPEAGPAMFRLGKLYADQGQESKASEWYARAVDVLTEDGRLGGSYVRRASRYVAERAFRAREFETAERYLRTLIDAGEGGAADLDRLAVASARVGKYEEAEAAWKQSILVSPADANRARYGLRLASMASKLKEPPRKMPSGKTWTEATREELESLLKGESDRVKQIQAEVAAAGTVDKKTRMGYRARIVESRAIFTVAALEYTLRGHGIRETAFFGGYAPLILNRTAWRLPRNPEPPQE